MPKRLFDTSILIGHFRSFPKDEEKSEERLRDWGMKLTEIHSTKWICSPVLIEVLAGTHNQEELAHHRAYLSAFSLIDEGKIPPSDWEEARRLAQRVPGDRSAKARDLGDCIISAIAARLHCEVLAFDRWFGRNR